MRPNANDIDCNVSLAYDTSPGTLWGMPGRQFSDNAVTLTLPIKPILSELALVNTSLEDTASGMASVGEVLEFQVTIILAELSTDLIATVSIPTGMTVLTAEVVSVGQQILNSSIAAGEGVAFTAGSVAQTVAFDFTVFGSIINVFTNQEEGSEDGIVLTVSALVADIDAVVKGGQLSVGALITADGVAGAALGPIITTVVQPILTARVYPESFVGSVDAGDELVYRIEANHTQTSNAAAYFMNLTAAVGEFLNIVGNTSGVPEAIAVYITPDQKEISWLVPMLTIGQHWFHATFTAEVTETVFPNTPGVNVSSSGVYMTSSDLSLARSLSFVAESDDVTVDEVVLAISLAGTSDDLTVDTDLAIGEAGFVVISAQLPEVTSQIVLTLHYNSSRFQVTQTTASYVGEVLACVNDAPSLELFSSQLSIGYQAASYDFGICQNAADNTETDADRIRVYLTVIPLDAAGNFDEADIDLISELQYTVDQQGRLGSSTESLHLAIAEPDFELTAVQPSTDPYIKALQEITWQLNVSTSFGREVVFTVELPAYMHYNYTMTPGFAPDITATSAGGAGNARTLTLSFGVVSTNESISFTIVTTAYADMEPGYAFPTVSVDMAWTTAISNGRVGAASAAYGQIFVADIQSFSELTSNVIQTPFSNFTIDESIFVEIAVYFRGSFPLVIFIAPPKTDAGQLIASVQTVALTVGSRITATGVPEGQTLEPTVTVHPNTSLTTVDFGLLALSNVAVGTITSADLVQVQCRFLVNQQSAWNVAGIESSIDTRVDYAGFTVTDTLDLKLLEPSLLFTATSNTSIDDPIEAGTVVLFTFSVFAEPGPERAPAYDARIDVDVGDFLPTSYQLLDSSQNDSSVTASATTVTIGLAMLKPGETWAVTFLMEAGGMLPAGATSSVTISPAFDSFPGIDDRLNAGRVYSSSPASHVATFAVKPFALSISRTESRFHAGGQLAIGGDMIFEVDFVLPYATLYDTALTFALPVAPGGVYSLVATAPGRPNSLNASDDVSVESFDITMNSTVFVIVDLGVVQRSIAAVGTGQVRVALAVHVADSSMNAVTQSYDVSADLTSANFNVSTPSAAAGYAIVEPQLVHSLSVRPHTTVDAGDTIYAHHIIAHDMASTSIGYALDMVITAPGHVQLITSDIWYTLMAEADVAAWQEVCDMPADVSCFGTDISGSVTIDGSSNYLNFGEIPRGQVLVVTYAAHIQQTVGPGDSLELQASLAWASRPDCAGACTGTPRAYTTSNVSDTLVATDVTVPAMSLASMTGVGTAVPPQAAQAEQFDVTLAITFPESTSGTVTLDVRLPVAEDGTAAMHLASVPTLAVGHLDININYNDARFGSTQHNGTVIFGTDQADTFQLIFGAVNTFDNQVTADDTLLITFTVAVNVNLALVSGYDAVMVSTVSAGGAQQTGSLSITIVAPVLTTDFVISPNLGMTELMADGNDEVWFNVTIFHDSTSLRLARDVSIDIELSGAAQFFIIDSPNFVTSSPVASPTPDSSIAIDPNATATPSSAPSSVPPPIQYHTETVSHGVLLLSETISLQIGVRIEGGVLPNEGICFVANVSYLAPAAGSSAADPQHRHEGTACWYWTAYPTTSPTGMPTMVPTFGLDTSNDNSSDASTAIIGAVFGSIAAVLIITVLLLAFVASKKKKKKEAACAGVQMTGAMLDFPSISPRKGENAEVDQSIYAIPSTNSNYATGDGRRLDSGEYASHADVYAEAAAPPEGVYADNEDPLIYDNRAKKEAVYGMNEPDGDVYEMANLDTTYAQGAADDGNYAMGDIGDDGNYAMGDIGDDGNYALGDDGLGDGAQQNGGRRRPKNAKRGGDDIYANDVAADDENVYGMAEQKEEADDIYGLGSDEGKAFRRVDSVYGNARPHGDNSDGDDDAVYGLAETSFSGSTAQDGGAKDGDIYDNHASKRRSRGPGAGEDEYENNATLARRVSDTSVTSNHSAIYGLYGAGQDTMERAAFDEMLGGMDGANPDQVTPYPTAVASGQDLVPGTFVNTFERRDSFQEPGMQESGRELSEDPSISEHQIEEDFNRDTLEPDGYLEVPPGYLEMPAPSLVRRGSTRSISGAGGHTTTLEADPNAGPSMQPKVVVTKL